MVYVIHTPLLCVQWKTPDDGQRNCPKRVEFYSKNKLEKLVHLVCFIIRIYLEISKKFNFFVECLCPLPIKTVRTDSSWWVLFRFSRWKKKCYVQSYLKPARQWLRKLAILRLWTLLLISHVFSVRKIFPLLPCTEMFLILSMNQQCFTKIATVILALLFTRPLIFSPGCIFLVENLRDFSYALNFWEQSSNKPLPVPSTHTVVHRSQPHYLPHKI